MASKRAQKQLELLCSARTTEEELYALRSLNSILGCTKDSDGDPENIEEEFLRQSKTVLEEGNPYPWFQVCLSMSSHTIFSKKNLLYTIVIS